MLFRSKKPVWVFAVPSVGRAAGGLRIGHGERFWVQNAQKSLGRHGSGAYLYVIGLLQHAPALGPEGLQTKEEFLKG